MVIWVLRLGLATPCTEGYMYALLTTRLVQIVVCRPDPYVLKVDASSLFRNMHTNKSGNALLVNRRGRRSAIWCFGTIALLKIRACEAAYCRLVCLSEGVNMMRSLTDTSMDIPQARWRGWRRCDVDFDENGASLIALSGHDHIRPLNRAFITRTPYLHYWLRVVHICEELAT